MMPDPVTDQGLTADQLEAAVAEVLQRAEVAEARYAELRRELAALERKMDYVLNEPLWGEDNTATERWRNALTTILDRIPCEETRFDELAAEKDAAYRERDRLVCALSKLWPAHLARHPDSDTTWDDEWRWIVCIHSPVGQLSWHIHDSERVWFDDLFVRDNDWDGHTTEEKYARLMDLVSTHEHAPERNS